MGIINKEALSYLDQRCLAERFFRVTRLDEDYIRYENTRGRMIRFHAGAAVNTKIASIAADQKGLPPPMERHAFGQFVDEADWPLTA